MAVYAVKYIRSTWHSGNAGLSDQLKLRQVVLIYYLYAGGSSQFKVHPAVKQAPGIDNDGSFFGNGLSTN